MSPNRPFAVPSDLGAAIARLPDGDPARRRTRAVARLLEAGLRPREIAELDIGDHRSAAPDRLDLDAPRVEVAGRKSRVVHLGAGSGGGSRRVSRGSPGRSRRHRGVACRGRRGGRLGDGRRQIARPRFQTRSGNSTSRGGDRRRSAARAPSPRRPGLVTWVADRRAPATRQDKRKPS